MNILSKINKFIDNLDDSYGIALIVLLFIIILYSMNNVEGMEHEDPKPNGNGDPMPKPKANRAPMPKPNGNGAPKPNGNGAPKVNASGAKGNGFNISEIGKLLPTEFANANTPLDKDTPPSMKVSKEMVNQMGLPSGNVFSDMYTEEYAKFEPIINKATDSRVKAFDPTVGGLLDSQMGKHVKSAVKVSDDLNRNNAMGFDINNVYPYSISDSQFPKMMDDSGAKAQGSKPEASASKGDLNLRMIYTTWCGHSKRALPDFDKVINDHHGTKLNGYNINVTKHDADKEKGVAKKFGVSGFPSYVLETPNGVKDVKTRSYDGLVKTIKENTV